MRGCHHGLGTLKGQALPCVAADGFSALGALYWAAKLSVAQSQRPLGLQLRSLHRCALNTTLPPPLPAAVPWHAALAQRHPCTPGRDRRPHQLCTHHGSSSGGSGFVGQHRRSRWRCDARSAANHGACWAAAGRAAAPAAAGAASSSCRRLSGAPAALSLALLSAGTLLGGRPPLPFFATPFSLAPQQPRPPILARC